MSEITSDGCRILGDDDSARQIIGPGPYSLIPNVSPFVITPGETYWRIKFQNSNGVRFALPVSAMEWLKIPGAGTPPTQGLTPEEAAKRKANVDAEAARSAEIERQYEAKNSLIDALSESFKDVSSKLTLGSKITLLIVAGVIILVLIVRFGLM